MLEIDKTYNIDAIELLKQIPDKKIDLCYCDPPFNISHKKKIYRDYRSGTHADLVYDYGEWDYEYDPIPFLNEAKRTLVDGGSFVIHTSEQLYGTYRDWAEQDEEMLPKQMLVWIKANPVPNFRKVSHRQATELMIWMSKGPISKKNTNFQFTTQTDTVNWKITPICAGHERLKRPDTGKSHPNQKPLAICKWVIGIHCRPDGLVLDPYCGVGSIADAAKQLGRHYISNDFDPVYVEMAKQRLGEAT